MTQTKPKVATCLWFDGNAEEAASFYTSLLPDSRITNVARPDPDRPALIVEFALAGTAFQALNGGPQFPHTEAASISVMTEDQEDTDRLWALLTADGGSESRCGWLKDRFGLSWQIVPEPAIRLLDTPNRAASERAMEAVLGMRKIDIGAVEAAYAGKVEA